MGLLISSTLRFLRLRSKPTVFLLGFVILGLTGSAEASGWQIEVVDSSPGYGWPVLRLNRQGFPCLSYEGRTSGLRHTRWNGSIWVKETLDSANLIRTTCLVLDSNNLPYIAYHDRTHGSLKYAFWDGVQWQIEVVDSGGTGYFPSLALDHRGFPHITYSDTVRILSKLAFKYAYWNGTSWVKGIVVDSFSLGFPSALTLDSLNGSHVAYRNHQLRYLKYAYWDGALWQKEIVDTSGGDAGMYPSMRFDSRGQSLISSVAGSVAMGLMLSRHVDSVWNTEMVAWHSRHIGPNWLYISPKDSVSIAYCVDEEGVFAAIQAESGWMMDTVVFAGIYGGVSLAVDSASGYHVTYLDGSWIYHAWKDFSGVKEKEGVVSFQPQAFGILPSHFRKEVMIIFPKGGKNKRNSVRVYDVTGRLVKELKVNNRSAVWDGRDEKGRLMSAGVYCVVLEGEVQRISQPVVLIR